MKKYLGTLGVLLLTLLVACQIPNATTGSLTISLPSPRAVVQNGGKGDLVRIQLVRNGTIVALSGQPYLQQGLAGQTTTLDGLPSGSGYTLLVASGELKTKFFEVGYFQASDPFEISAGADTKVSVTLNKTPIRLLNSGTDVPHAALAYLKGTKEHLRLVGAGATAVDHFDLTTEADLANATPVSPSLKTLGWPTGASFRSLGLFIDPVNQTNDVFYNTDKGVGFIAGSSFNFAMKDANGVAFKTPPVVNLSGSFQVGSAGPVTTLNVYSGPHLTAALAITGQNDKSGVLWNDLVTTMDVNKILDSIGVDPNNIDTLVSDFATAKDFAYIATAMSTYRVDSTMLQGDVQALSDKFTNGSDDVVVKVSYNGKSLPIEAVSAYEGSTEGRVFVGTSKGLFTAATNLVGNPKADLTLVPGTYGLKIAHVATKAFGDQVYTAAYAANSGEVLIVNGADQVVSRLPRLQGLPSGDLKLTWWVESGTSETLKLVVSGDDASVVYTAK